MLSLFRGPLPPPERELQPRGDSGGSDAARRFARVVALHRQRHPSGASHRRYPPEPRNCATQRRRAARTARRRKVEAEPEPGEQDAELDASIRSLQAHISSLERSSLLRDSATLLWRINSSAVALDLTREYFLQFVHGYDAERDVSTRRFVTSFFQPDILCRDFQGIEAFLDQWEKYTTFHQGLTFQFNTARVVDNDEDERRCAVSVYARGEIHVTFTQDTLKFLYPTLYTQSLRDLHERGIVDTLVGSRGCLPMEIVLNFDPQGRVFAFESRVDLVSTLLRVLHSPSAAIHAHQLSIMTTDGHWQPATDVEAAALREQRLPRQLL